MFRNIILERTLEFSVDILNSSHSTATQNHIVLLPPQDIRMFMKKTEFNRHSDWIMLNYNFFLSLSCFLYFIYLKLLIDYSQISLILEDFYTI